MIANAIKGNYPNYSIDPTKVLISRGALTPAVNAMAIPVSGAINFEWDDNSGLSSAKPTDKALLAVVNTDKSEAVFDAAGAQRSKTAQSLSLPSNWSDDSVEIYMGFVSKDGREVANSVYLGSFTVA